MHLTTEPQIQNWKQNWKIEGKKRENSTVVVRDCSSSLSVVVEQWKRISTGK